MENTVRPTTSPTWRDALSAQMSPAWAEEIDLFESQMQLKRQGRIDDRVFAETRLRRGVYGQRYDNGQRHDGIQDRTLVYPGDHLTKGPETLWDAPGMQRIKVPYGGLSAVQLEVLGAVADEYADGILHVTTRQDIQLHYVHIDDTPDMMRRLAAVGITTREACGNSVRNITGCPLAGVCHTESFDISPYAHALTFFLLGHDDIQDFGRKFKPAFSGCEHEACGLVKMHDMGFLARVRQVDGQQKRGFAIYVGGGLGTLPHQAKVLSEFTPEEELLPIVQAVARVYTRLGEKRNRNRARIKFLVADLGIEEFRRLVYAEREILPYDPRWTAYLDHLDSSAAVTAATSRISAAESHPSTNGNRAAEDYKAWFRTNVYPQRQQGFNVVTVHLPLGDLTTAQAFQLADLARTYVGDNLRTTVEQNIVLRWVADASLPDLYHDLQAIGLGEPGAGTIVDITACPGTDTCKLGIASSRGLAGELRTRLAAASATLPEAITGLRVKVSGCFNSCGQHHIADIGFFGNSRHRNNRTVPHFQVVLGGQWRENGGSFGLAVGAVPSKSVPDVLDAILARYAHDRERGESFQAWTSRLGKKEIKTIIEPFAFVPDYAVDPTVYSDWGDPREFTLGDIGVGECAGEVVSLFVFEATKAEGEAFEALVALDEGDYRQADLRAYKAMLLAAKALVRTQYLDVGDDPNRIVAEFKTRFYDTELFFDKYVKGKFAQYLFDRHARPDVQPTQETARQVAEQANLFIEAAHACDARLTQRSNSLL